MAARARTVRLYRPCGALIGHAKVPNLGDQSFGAVTWDGRAFIQDPADPTAYHERLSWDCGDEDLERAQGQQWQEKKPTAG